MEFAFYLKKAISFFIEPIGMVITLFVLGLYLLLVKKDTLAKISLLLSLGLLLLFSYQPFANFLVTDLESEFPKYYHSQGIKYIHVLGAGHNTDDTQPVSSNVSDAGTKRVLEGVMIHKDSPDSRLIFTGYAGKSEISSAVMYSRLAMALGVKKEDIIIHGESKDTKEEALFAKSIVDKEPLILVTSATHMPRSMKLFRSVGLNVAAAPTDFLKEEVNYYFKAPNVDSLDKSTRAIHEYFGLLWANIRG